MYHSYTFLNLDSQRSLASFLSLTGHSRLGNAEPSDIVVIASLIVGGFDSSFVFSVQL